MPPFRPTPNRPAGRGPASFLRGLLVTLGAVFAAQKVLEIWFGSNLALEAGALSLARLRAGYFWTPFSHVLLHGGVLHLLCNLTGLYYVGRPLEEIIGPRRLAALSLLGALGAGLVWLAVNGARPGYMIGASGVGMAYMAAFVALDPRRPLTIPFWQETVPAWWLVAGVGALDLAGLALRAFAGLDASSGIAHSAHLGGLASGWLCHRLFLAPRSLLYGALRPRVEPPRWATRGARRPATVCRVDLDPPAPPPVAPAGQRAEVDRLLDRIGKHGYDSLSAAERAFLAEAGRRAKSP